MGRHAIFKAYSGPLQMVYTNRFGPFQALCNIQQFMHHTQQEAAKAQALQQFQPTKRAFPMLRDPAQVFVATLDSFTASPLREPNPMFPESSPCASGPPFADPDIFLSLEQRVENIPAKDHPKLNQVVARGFEKGESEAFQQQSLSVPLEEEMAVVCYATNLLNDPKYEPISCAPNEVGNILSSLQLLILQCVRVCPGFERQLRQILSNRARTVNMTRTNVCWNCCQ